MKNLVIYHKATSEVACLDGLISACIAYSGLLPLEVEFFGQVHFKEDEYSAYEMPFNYKNRRVFILDFCFPEYVLNKICKEAHEVIVLDHHETRKDIILKTAYDLSFCMAQKFKGVYSPNELDCGATLTWKHFREDEAYPWFLEHIFSRDTGAYGYYTGENLKAETCTTAIFEMLNDCKIEVADAFEVFIKLCNADEFFKDTIFEKGKRLLEKRQKLIDQELAFWLEERKLHIKDLEIMGFRIPLLKIQNPEADKYISNIGSQLVKLFPEVPVAILPTTSNEFVSLRSAEECKISCAMLAKYLGGGGHKNAAGFKLEKGLDEN